MAEPRIVLLVTLAGPGWLAGEGGEVHQALDKPLAVGHRARPEGPKSR